MHGGQPDLPKALEAPSPIEERHGLPKAVDGPLIVALGMVCEAEVTVCKRVQDPIAARRDEREGMLGGGDGLSMRTHEPTKV
jgi:hypothetical protein